MSEFTEEELSDTLIDIKDDLRYQLTFENIDWDYFENTVRNAREIQNLLNECSEE